MSVPQIANQDLLHPVSLPAFNKKINFVYEKKRRTANPLGWEEYKGGIYNSVRGYGWLTEMSDEGRDRGASATIVLADGTERTPHSLERLELANWQGTHQENLPLVFRIDLPNGWYRVTCTSVDPGAGMLPLVDRRSFKCRAGGAVFAGARYGAPLAVRGNQLVEGSDIVEVTDRHLRIVIGDPAYAGWSWRYRGPWYKGWKRWLDHDHQYAAGWYQKLTRQADPGFHSLRLNSLEVAQVAPPSSSRTSLIFRDRFNRDDSPDINAGLAPPQQWRSMKIHPDFPDSIVADLYRTSIRVSGPAKSTSVVALLQQMRSPATGVIRYTSRVSMFTGEGSRQYQGMQEAGILLLVEPSAPSEHAATFVGVRFDSNRPGTPGWLLYRVGDGKGGYSAKFEIPDTELPFEIREGEYEFVVEHDASRQVLRRITVNAVDLTSRVPLLARKQRLDEGLFGIRSMLSAVPGRRLQQFYWHYRVEESNGRPL